MADLEENYVSPFSDWDPLAGDVPNYRHDEFKEIILRAREILEGRTTKAICHAQRQLDKALQKIGFDMYEDSFKHIKAGRHQWYPLEKQMELIKDANYLKKIGKGNNLTWPEYHAVLSLSVVTKACDTELKKHPIGQFIKPVKEEIEEYYPKIADKALIEAQDITDVASRLYEIHIHRQIGGKEKHKKSKKDILKYQFIVYRLTHPRLSVRSAVTNFYPSRPDKDLQLDSDDEHTIYKFFLDAFNKFETGELELPEEYLK